MERRWSRDCTPGHLIECLHDIATRLALEHERQAAALRTLQEENEKLKEAGVASNDLSYTMRTLEGSSPPVPRGARSEGTASPKLDRAATMTSALSSTWSSALRTAGIAATEARDTNPPDAEAEEEVLEEIDVDQLRPLRTARTSSDLALQSRHSKSNFVAEEKVQFMIMRAEKSKRFGSKKPGYVINPDSFAAITWQMVTSCCMGFVALVTPVQVGLLDMRFDAIFFFSLCVDLVFLIDMILQFFTMYPKSTARGIEWEHRCGHICAHYLRTWFALDFVTIIPFDILSLAFGTDNFKELKSIKVVRALRLLKLMRMLKSSRLLHKLEIALSIPYQHFALIRFLFGLVLVCHWLSCFWAMCLHLVNDDIPKWIDEIAASDARFGIETSPIRVYIASFYFCSYTMTSVGYGDLGPQNILERIVCTIIVLVAGLCWAQILGEVCAISSDMNAETSAFRKKMNSLNMMMQEQGLPHDLRRRLRSFFLQNRHQAQYVVRQKLLDNMSPQLQSEVCTEMNLPWIQKVTFFSQFMAQIEIAESRGIDTDPYRVCIADTSRQLRCGAFAQRESFDNIQVLYILSKGLVVLNSKVGTNGTVWGEDFVLSDTSLIRPVGGFALTYIEVLFLTRESFMQVIERRRLTCPQLGRIVRRYCIRVAVRRGVIYEAKRIARQRRREERQRRMEEEGDVPSSVEVPPLPPEQQDISCPSQSLPGMPEVRAGALW